MKRFALVLLFLLVALPASAANRFLTCNTTCTITAIDTTIWGTTTGGTGASVPGSSDAVVLDGATCVGGTTCTATMGAGYNPTWQSITMGACTASTTGCIFDWSVNNNNVTLTATGGFSGTGSGTRNLKMGNGNWSLTSTSNNVTPWVMTTTTNLTFNANSSTIDFAGVVAAGGGQIMQGGGLTYSTVKVSGARLNSGLAIAGNSTVIGTLTASASASISFTGSSSTITNLATTNGAALILSVPNGTTTTVTNAPTLVGSFSSPISILNGATAATSSAATISTASGTFSCSYCSAQGVAFSGGATFTFTNSLDLGHNTGAAFTAPQTGGGGIIGGWLFDHDLNPANDNFPVFLNKAA